jgi:hypothetical protein
MYCFWYLNTPAIYRHRNRFPEYTNAFMKQSVQGGKTMAEQFYADRTYLRDLLKRHPEWTTAQYIPQQGARVAGSRSGVNGSSRLIRMMKRSCAVCPARGTYRLHPFIRRWLNVFWTSVTTRRITCSGYPVPKRSSTTCSRAMT